MSFIAAAPSPKADEEKTISNNGFFPDIDPERVRGSIAIDGTITTQKLKEAIIGGIVTANGDLEAYQATAIANGFSKLSEVPADKINDEHIKVTLYIKAVTAFARAHILENTPNYDSTAEGLKRAENLIDATGSAYREGRFAIRDILGKSRYTVELL